MTASCLIAVDVQAGFVNEWTRHVPGRVAALQAGYDLVVATRFVNPEGSLYRRLIGWHRFAPGSPDTALAFTPRADALVVDKARYSCLVPAVVDLLERHAVARVDLAGIATDNCVLKTAVDLFERGIEPVVHAGACGSHGGPECHAAGLLLLRRFIGASQVIEDGT